MQQEKTMKIVVAYNGTSAAKNALKLALSRAKVYDATLLIITSLEGGDKETQEDYDTARDHLGWAESRCREESVPCETHLLIRGLSPGEDIVQFVLENNADEIIIGVRMRSRVGKLLLGSVAQHVILRAHCPVTTVK